MSAASLLWNRFITSCYVDVSDVCVIIELQGKADGIQRVLKEPECFCIRGIHHNVNYVVPLVWKGCRDSKNAMISVFVSKQLYLVKSPLFYFLTLKLKLEEPEGDILQALM